MQSKPSKQPENRFRFTEPAIAKYKPPTDQAEHSAWDTETRGLSIRYQFGAGGTYMIRYRIGGKQRKLKLGRVGAVTLADVRKEARQAMAGLSAVKAIDPALERKKANAAASQRFGDAIEGYIARLARDVKAGHRSASYLGQNTMYLRSHFKGLHGVPLVAITKKMVSGELKAMVSDGRGRITANRARAALSTFFLWAIKDGDYQGLDNNPVAMTSKNIETARGRNLRPRELKAIWDSAGKLGEFGDIVRLLMLTMQRRNEIAMLRMSEFNRKERQIEIPKERAKNGVPSDIPLSDAAFDILNRYYDPGRKFIFGVRDSGYQGWTKSKAQIDRLCGVNEHWTFHDFRRAGKTAMEQTLRPAVADNVSEAILNHAKKGLAVPYNGATYMDWKREALAQYSDYLMEVVA